MTLVGISQCCGCPQLIVTCPMSFWQQGTAKGTFPPKMAAAMPTVCRDAIRELKSLPCLAIFSKKGHLQQKRLLQCHRCACNAVKETHFSAESVFYFWQQAIIRHASTAWQSAAVATAFPTHTRQTTIEKAEKKMWSRSQTGNNDDNVQIDERRQIFWFGFGCGFISHIFPKKTMPALSI